ncbi:MAG: hypothetical protein ACSLE6_05610 [Mycobacterium sp.]
MDEAWRDKVWNALLANYPDPVAVDEVEGGVDYHGARVVHRGRAARLGEVLRRVPAAMTDANIRLPGLFDGRYTITRTGRLGDWRTEDTWRAKHPATSTKTLPDAVTFWSRC